VGFRTISRNNSRQNSREDVLRSAGSRDKGLSAVSRPGSRDDVVVAGHEVSTSVRGLDGGVDDAEHDGEHEMDVERIDQDEDMIDQAVAPGGDAAVRPLSSG